MHPRHVAVNPNTSKSSRVMYTLSVPAHVLPSPASPCGPCPSSRFLLLDAFRPSWHRLRSHHGTATIISILRRSHLCIRCLPLDRSCEPKAISVHTRRHLQWLPLVPKHTPSSHMHVNFPSGPPARFLFHESPSANDKPCTFADFPISRSYAVVPSRPTWNLVKRNPARAAYRSDHSLHRLNRSLNDPLLFEVPTGLSSRMIIDPLYVDLRVLHDSIKLVSAVSMSDFTMMMSTNSSPNSRSHAISLRHIHTPVISYKFLFTLVA